MIANAAVAIDATSHGFGKYLKRQTPSGISQPNTYQKLRSVTQCQRAMKKFTGARAWPAMFHGHLICPAIAE
jgi:hypothetical protein